MKAPFIIKKIGCLIVVAALASMTNSAQASVIVSIGSAEMGANETATVDLNISGLGNGTALGTFDLSIGFDPSILSFQGARFGDPTVGDQLDLEGFGTLTATTPTIGNAELFELSLDSPGALTGGQASSFTLAALTFTGLVPGSSALNLSINALGDQNGSPIGATLDGGSVTVTPVPIPGALLLLCSGLGALGLSSKPRRKAAE